MVKKTVNLIEFTFSDKCLTIFIRTNHFVSNIDTKESMSMKEVIYRCPVKCLWKKKCFVCKVQGDVNKGIVILHKCVVTKEDIPVQIGNR